MANKEERLIRLIRREQSGKGGNYEEICELLFDEINNLVRPVCQSAEESRKKVKKLFVRMLQQIDEIDTNDDIHLWIAGFTTVTLYELLCRENGQIITYRSGNIDYQYSHIDDDDELRLKVRDYNDALANPKRYMFGKEFFSKLSKGQIILFEMFCYEGFTIDEIQELLEVDKIYITSELAAIKAIVLGNTDEEVELISENDTDIKENVKSYATSEDDNDDIAAIKAAVAAIVNDTVDEVNTENEGYKDIVSAVNAIKSEPDYNNNDTLGATLVNINKEHINNIIKNSENKTGKDDTEIELTEDKLKNDTPKSEKKAKTKDIEADYIDEDEADADYDKSDKKKGLAGLFGFEDLSDDEDDEDDEDEADNKTVKRDRMADDDSLVNSGKTNKILKILSIVVPSVAVVVFIVILLTSGVFNKSSSTSNSVTAAETKTSTKKQESTTQESTTAKATEKSTQKTTAAKQTEQTTTAKQVEKTTEAKTEAQNNNTTRTSQQQNNQADNDSDTQATESNTQATEAPTQATAAPTQATAAPTQATEGNTQATEGNTQATAAPTDAPTQATSAPTQADTVVDEKNGTALH